MADTMNNYQGASCDWYDLPCHLSSFADWLGEYLLWFPRKIFEMFMDGAASLVEAIPVPGFFASAQTLFAGIPSGVIYFATPFELGYGITACLGALVLRFLLRRVPFIG